MPETWARDDDDGYVKSREPSVQEMQLGTLHVISEVGSTRLFRPRDA